MNTKGELNESFLLQDFGNSDIISGEIERFRLFASGYALIENAIAVLSDLKDRKSYIYYGGMARTLGLDSNGGYKRADSIWEEDVFKCIPPKDLERKHLDELKFIHFLRNHPKDCYTRYFLTNILSMTGEDGCEYTVRHRVFYVGIESNGSIRLALCLYNLAGDKSIRESYICDSLTGRILSLEQQDYNDLLSKREKEVLKHITRGLSSKEISEALSISIHTVSRHRQNILSKLCASNSIEACRIAKQLRLI